MCSPAVRRWSVLLMVSVRCLPGGQPVGRSDRLLVSSSAGLSICSAYDCWLASLLVIWSALSHGLWVLWYASRSYCSLPDFAARIFICPLVDLFILWSPRLLTSQATTTLVCWLVRLNFVSTRLLAGPSEYLTVCYFVLLLFHSVPLLVCPSAFKLLTLTEALILILTLEVERLSNSLFVFLSDLFLYLWLFPFFWSSQQFSTFRLSTCSHPTLSRTISLCEGSRHILVQSLRFNLLYFMTFWHATCLPALHNICLALSIHHSYCLSVSLSLPTVSVCVNVVSHHIILFIH